MSKDENWYEIYWNPTWITAKTKEEAERKVDKYLVSNDSGSWMDVNSIELDKEITKKMKT